MAVRAFEYFLNLEYNFRLPRQLACPDLDFTDTIKLSG